MIAVYVVFPAPAGRDGTVHLSAETPTGWADRTLCGRTVPLAVELGDETLHGLRATCRTCKAVLANVQA